MTSISFPSLIRTLILLSALGFGGPASAIEPELPPLRDGDIVFQNTASSARNAIMAASGTEYTHVGMIELGRDGRPNVLEAVGPVRSIPLADWLDRGTGHRITVKRIKGLDEEKAKSAIGRARDYLGRPYDYFFYETRDQIYCSELVHASFKEGPNISVGSEQKMRDLNIDTPAARGLIEQRWRKHPLCRDKRASTFKACYNLILDQTVVTPASIARDPQLELVYSNFGPGAE